MQAAKLSGLPASTLRYYEDDGLLGQIARDEHSGHRRYSDNDLDLAVAIACLSATGMSISEMRAYLANRQHGEAAVAAQLQLLKVQQRRLRDEAVSLQLRQAYIDSKVGYWEAIAAHNPAQQRQLAQRVAELAAQVHQMKAAGPRRAATRDEMTT